MALDIGHGLGSLLGKKKYTAKHVEQAYDLCREIAMMIDRELGLEPDIGRW